MEKINFKNNSEPALSANNLNQIQDNIENEINISTPIGIGFDYYGTKAPKNYMFADGSAISRTEYAELFEIIGTIYGEGDGSTTFNLPDKRERVSVMRKEGSTNGTSGATMNTIGAKGGEFNHKLILKEIPSHNHRNNTSGINELVFGATGWNLYAQAKGLEAGIGAFWNKGVPSQGGDQPHNNLQPYLVCNYIIKVK